MRELRPSVAIATWMARLTPLILISMAGYVTYVMVGLLSVSYLLVKRNNKVAAVLILIIYCLILIILIASFLRLTYTTYCDPPYVPLGKVRPPDQGSITARESYGEKEKFVPSGLELFYEKNVFISDYTGRPYWCIPCANWKPDRAHHCSQTGRCIRKMDHFCPWVGGPVGENNFKFFIQFTSYGALYCAYVLIIIASITSSKQKKEGEQMETAFIVTLGLASTFLLFSASMSFHGIRLAISNMTQIERMGSKKRVYTLAAHVPPKGHLANENNIHQSLDNHLFINYSLTHNTEQLSWPKSTLTPAIPQEPSKTYDQQSNNAHSSSLSHVSQPSQISALKSDASEESSPHQKPPNSDLIDQDGANMGIKTVKSNDLSEGNFDALKNLERANAKQPGHPTSNSKETLANNSLHQKIVRTFVVLTTNEGDNPWDLGSRLLNWKTVMGNSMLDWVLPIHRSPCCNHDNPEGQFQFGFAVNNLLSKFGLEASDGTQNNKSH